MALTGQVEDPVNPIRRVEDFPVLEDLRWMESELRVTATSSSRRCLDCLYLLFEGQEYSLALRKPYVTGFGKRDLIAQITIFLYRRFSATTPKNNSRDKPFVFVSEVSPTLCYTHTKFERVEVFLKGQVRCLKTAT